MKTRILLIPVLLLLFCSCKGDKCVEKNMTMIVYVAGDNNLSGYINYNLNGMRLCMDGAVSSENNLIVFVDRHHSNSYMLNINNMRCDTIRRWNENLDSSSPDVLSMVIDYVRKEYKSRKYGLLMWSHGTGWVPSATHRFIGAEEEHVVFESNAGKKRLPVVYDWHNPLNTGGFVSADRNPNPDIRRPFERTRAICANELPGEFRWMEYDGMADAIPDGMFDIILFDACYMSGAEVAYELRNKTKWMIGSAVEIMANGFPYQKVTPYFFNGDYVSICREFYNYYYAQRADSRTAGIALMDMAKLDNLSLAFRDVVVNASVGVDDLYGNIQRTDRFKFPIMFDLFDVAEKLEPGEACLDRFRKAMDECVVYKKNTQYIVGELELKTYCGLNCYVPFSGYEGVINGFYRNTGWNETAGFYRNVQIE